MSSNSCVVACILCVCLTGCDRSHPESLNDVFDSTEAPGIIHNAGKVYVSRLPTPNPFHESLEEYNLTAEEQLLDQETMSLLQDMLLDVRSYGPTNINLACLPDYGVRLRFEDTDGNVDVLFCFHCTNVAIYLDGQIAGGELISYSERRFLRIFRRLFPDDAALNMQ